MTTYTHQAGRARPRHLVLLGALGLHILAFEFISLTVSNYKVTSVPDRLQAFFLDDVRPTSPLDRIDRHQSPAPQLEQPVPDPIAPDITIVVPPDATMAMDPGGPTATAADSTPVGTAPTADTEIVYTARRSPDDFYPPASVRLGEEGAAVLRVCVDASGALQGVPAVTAGSGHPRLDEAARSWASHALVFRPATRNAAPVAACKGFRVSFHLRN